MTSDVPPSARPNSGRHLSAPGTSRIPASGTRHIPASGKGAPTSTYRVQLTPAGKALDRGDGALLDLDCQHQAGVDHHTIQQHRARAALALIAGALGAGQPELYTQGVRE